MPMSVHHHSIRTLALLSGLALTLSSQASPIVQPELIIVDETGNNGRFGTSLAATDGILAVGSPLDSTDYTLSGKVTIRRTIWTGTPDDPLQAEGALLETLTPGAGANNTTNFGSSLAFSSNCLAVGSPGWRGPADHSSAGGVFLYDVPHAALDSVFVEVLQHPDAYIGDDFGWSVAGCPIWWESDWVDRFLIGAPGRENEAVSSGDDAGAAYLYRRPPGWNNFVLDAVIQPAWVQGGDRFGASVGAYMSFYVVGAPGWNEGEGAVFLFMYDQTLGDFALIDTIEGSSTSCTGGFGASLDFDGTLVVGGTGGAGHASLHQIEIDYDTWPSPSSVQLQPVLELEPDDWSSITGWGSSVSKDGLKVLVGGEGIAALYRFDRYDPVLWPRLAMLDNDQWNDDLDDDLGTAVCVHDTNAWAGAPRSNEFDAGDGAVARWDVGGMPNCPADLDFDYDVDTDDMLVLISNLGPTIFGYGVNGELNHDDVINIHDLLLLIAAWGDCGS